MTNEQYQRVVMANSIHGDFVGKVKAVLPDGRMTIDWGFTVGPYWRSELQPIDEHHRPCDWWDEAGLTA